MHDLIVLNKEVKIDQSKFFKNYDEMYDDALTKKVSVSNSFYKKNIDLFEKND
jgi:hypothetical protein